MSPRLAAFARWLAAPFRAVVSLDRRQLRSLFACAMLGGIIALSAENWVLIGLAHHATESGEVSATWFGLLIERTRYNSGLQAWFAVIMGLMVFGADYMQAKWGDKSVGFGRNGSQPGEGEQQA